MPSRRKEGRGTKRANSVYIIALSLYNALNVSVLRYGWSIEGSGGNALVLIFPYTPLLATGMVPMTASLSIISRVSE
jgi:hypothetical protein